MRFLAALQFLTIIPLHLNIKQDEIGKSQCYFPLVGLFLGLILAGLSLLLNLFLPFALINILLIVLLVTSTGALHLDGFLDTCDGIAGHRTPHERLAVMRDSRAGGFAVIGTCCLLLLKYISLNTIPDINRITTLILMPVLGRWGAVYAIFFYPYARPHGLGKIFKEHANWHNFFLATLTALIVAIVLWRLPGLITMLGTWIIVLGMAGHLAKKFGGLTGDTYGAIIEVTETGVLIIISLLSYNHWFWT